jgi:DNA-binding Lrp family transcriptional regulator
MVCRSRRRHGGLTFASYEQRERPQLITAIVMVRTAADRIPETAQAIADLPGVAEVYSCAGDVDIIATVKVREHEELAEVIAGRLSKVEGVVGTETHIAFRSYSRADTDASFGIGTD